MGAFADTAAAQTPVVSASDKSVTEGDGIVFEVLLSTSSDRPVTVQYATESGVDTQRSNAQSGRDFTATSGTLSFAPGETRKTVRVSTTSDSAYEYNELFHLRLWNPTNARLRGLDVSLGYSRATGTIVDDDPPPMVSVSDASATEGDEVEFKISLSVPIERPVHVDLKPEVGPGDTATLHGDFDGSGGSLSMYGGGTARPSFTVRVATSDDDIDEEDETFTVRLSNPIGATLGDATATGTIIDDDGTPTSPPLSDLPTVGFWEGLDSNVPAGWLDEVSRVAVEALATGRFRSSTGHRTGPHRVGRTLSLRRVCWYFSRATCLKEVYVRTTRRDRTGEGNETLTLTLSNPTNATLGDATATGTITEARHRCRRLAVCGG